MPYFRNGAAARLVAMTILVSACADPLTVSSPAEPLTFAPQASLTVPSAVPGQVMLCVDGPDFHSFMFSQTAGTAGGYTGTLGELTEATTVTGGTCKTIWTKTDPYPALDGFSDIRVDLGIVYNGAPAGTVFDSIKVTAPGTTFSIINITDVSVQPNVYHGAVVVYFVATAPAPALSIEKYTNDQDADTPTGPVLEVGSAVNWKYVVKNTGNVTLTNVTVTDDKLAPTAISCPGGTNNVVASLAAGAEVTCSAAGTAQAGQYKNIGTATGTYVSTTVTDTDPSHYFGEAPAGAVLLIIDEDGIDNGLHLNRTGGGITPSGPSFWTSSEVSDDRAAYGQRAVLRYFADPANFGRVITVRTGQTGDEGWFAPNCIPQKWLGSSSSSSDLRCMTGANRETGINNYFFSGLKPYDAASSWAIPQSRLDKIPHVMPLRARGLVALQGKDVCAVVYDSDVSINYDHGTASLGVNGNLQGSTLGIVAFTVNVVRTLNNFSSSTLPEVQITVRDPKLVCRNFKLLNAPVPNSSSEPNDRVVENLAGVGSKLYRRLFFDVNQPLVY
jgi:uncharacterized repeat protein (TIGR01451 family)